MAAPEWSETAMLVIDMQVSLIEESSFYLALCFDLWFYLGKFAEGFHFGGEREPDARRRRPGHRPDRDPGRRRRTGAWHIGDLGPSSFITICLYFTIFLINFFYP